MTVNCGRQDQPPFSIRELLVASCYPHAVTHLRLKETHLSWIVLTGHYAYKIKKPVSYDFIDASTLERRRFLCDEELRLNRRFAPELYLDVVPITRDSGRLMVGGTGKALEYAVRMREFAESEELASRLDRDAVAVEEIQAIAARLADAHRRAAVADAASRFGTLDAVRQPMLDNFSPLRTHLGDVRRLQLVERLEDWTRGSLARLRSLIEARRLAGMVRECHGDLHSRNIVLWSRQWMPFDCLEFDPALRWIDVISDVAFLYMDLVSRSRAALGYHFVSGYLECTGDYEGLKLVPLYSAYRALVRAKVDALGAETADAQALEGLRSRLEHRLDTAAGFVDAAPPALIIMHGVTASGKSWLSDRLIGAIPAVRVRSDLERKRLAGVAALAKRAVGVGEGDYSTEKTRAVYERLLDCAAAALDGNCSIIVDATFLDRLQRDAFRSLAKRMGRRFLIVSCIADPAILAGRLDARARGGFDPSEATRAVLKRQLQDAQPLGAEEGIQSIVIDMGRPVDTGATAEMIRARLGMQ